MRKLIVFGALAIAVIWFQNRSRPDALDEAWKRITLPYQVIRLSMQEPDAVLLMPVHRARVARVADTWQAPRSGGRRHEGLDILVARGTPVYSSTRGIVVRAGANKLGGNSVFVLGPGGRTYYYAHLDAYAEGIDAGQRVDTGTVLGYVGNTGNARGTPPHLHFGVYTAGGAMNPLPLLADRRAPSGRLGL
ncbi:MAG TPA: M23 family metallopeptidase [Bryobacteraceae bacterium]|nr:M23 family metallopeptidase [Bryobacteraceae bacterium]